MKGLKGEREGAGKYSGRVGERRKGRRIGGREKMMVKEEGGRCEREKRKIT